MNKEDIVKLIEEIENLQKNDSDNVIYVDSLEQLKLSLILLEKFEISKPKDEHISFNREDWGHLNVPFGRLKIFLEKLKYYNIINHLIFGLGGSGFFTIIDKLRFVREIDNIIKSVKENLGENEEESKQDVLKNMKIETITSLKEFKSFVEKDGFLAFWYNNKVNGKLKNNPEEIGKSQLMAFLTGRGTGYVAREVPVGQGRQDIIFIEDPKLPVIIETKVLIIDNKKYEEGKFQLKNYVKNNSYNEGYYIIFHTNNFYNDISFDEDNIKINQISINIRPQAPTKKFREKETE